MDSLLIILVVLGVVMILAGIAIMRNKRRQSWDDIDHSVLFSKNLHDDDSSVGEVRVVGRGGSARRQEPLMEDELHQIADIVVDEREETPAVAQNIHVKLDDDQMHAEKPKPSTPSGERARSILKKLRLEISDEEEPEEETVAVKKSYRDNAPDKVVVLNVMAPAGQHFVGAGLINSIEACGLQLGDMKIFHYNEDGAAIFSLVNMVKPGIFDMNTVDALSTPGVSLFIQMPNEQAKGVAAFDKMLAIAKLLAQQLGGEVRDERRNVLTKSAIDHIRQQIAEYDCKWLATA